MSFRILRLLLAGASLCLLVSCANGRAPARTGPDLAPFIELAKRTECADLRRRLLVIDERFVLFDRAGNCPDNGYSATLYDQSIDHVLCTVHDSIAGPMSRCEDQSYSHDFEIMTNNLDKPDLGLGSARTVRNVPL